MSDAPTKTPAEVVAEVTAELATLPALPLRVWISPAQLEQLRSLTGAARNVPDSFAGLELRETSFVKTWAVEMSDGTFQLPESELEDG